jgi:hypothetical protein
MDVSEARRLKSLEDENARLKRLLADAMLDNAALKDLVGKWCALRPIGEEQRMKRSHIPQQQIVGCAFLV